MLQDLIKAGLTADYSDCSSEVQTRYSLISSQIFVLSNLFVFPVTRVGLQVVRSLSLTHEAENEGDRNWPRRDPYRVWGRPKPCR